MPLITVYSFRYHDPEQNIEAIGVGKCRRDEIIAKGWIVIESTAEEIDSSLLTSTGRYHPSEPDSQA